MNNKKIRKIERKMERRLKKYAFLRDLVFSLIRKKSDKQSHIKYILVNNKRKSIYYGIPKVASTSLQNILYMKGFKRIDLNQGEGYKERNCFKFALVRNPYDKLVSCYENKIKKPYDLWVVATNYKKIYEDMPFKEFVKAISSIPDNEADRHFKSQCFFLMSKQGKLIPDFIGKFENLEEDYKKICKKIGIKNPPKLPHKRKSIRKKTYKDYYDEETKKLIYERYKKDFQFFGYEF